MNSRDVLEYQSRVHLSRVGRPCVKVTAECGLLGVFKKSKGERNVCAAFEYRPLTGVETKDSKLVLVYSSRTSAMPLTQSWSIAPSKSQILPKSKRNFRSLYRAQAVGDISVIHNSQSYANVVNIRSPRFYSKPWAIAHL